MFFILGKLWTDYYGNTYHSVTIWKGSDFLTYIPFEYGYDDAYIETALEWLEDNGYIEKREFYASGTKPGGTRFLREELNNSTAQKVRVNRREDL